MVEDGMLCAASRRQDTATHVDHHHYFFSFSHDTIDVGYLNKRLNREHKKIEGMPRHRTLISSGERERSDHAKLDVSIYRIFIQHCTMALCPKLPLDLRDHLCG